MSYSLNLSDYLVHYTDTDCCGAHKIESYSDPGVLTTPGSTLRLEENELERNLITGDFAPEFTFDYQQGQS